MFEIVLRPKSLLESSDCVGVKQQGHQERGGHRAGETFDRARPGSYWSGLAGDRRWAGQQDREWDRGECVGMCHDAFCRSFVFSHGAPPWVACSVRHDGMRTGFPEFVHVLMMPQEWWNGNGNGRGRKGRERE